VTRSIGVIFAWISVAALAAVLAPSVAPVDPTLHPPGEAVAFGGCAGGALFVVLARKRFPTSALPGVPRRRLLARALVLGAKSAQEEALWRAMLLGVLVSPLGRLGALTVSAVAFAAAHIPRQRRSAALHLGTGMVFGATYLVTGRLTSAVVAHASYNVLVGTAALADEMSLSATGTADGRLVASDTPTGRPTQMDLAQDTRTGPPGVAAQLDGVVKSFGATRALDGVDLELRPGEVLALLGANGAGKSTAVAVMLGLRRPDTGRALLFGRDPRAPSARRRVGAVLQEIGFPPTLRVRELIELVRAHYPTPRSTQDSLDALELTGLADREALALSGGQRRRLAVALAVAGRPEVLFLDEPTAGMDANARRSLLADLDRYAADGGAVLLTTQQLAEAEEIATRVVLLERGRVLLEGTVGEVRSRAGMTRVTLRAAVLPTIAGVASIESRRDRHVVYVVDGDAFVTDLVRSGASFRDLEVVPASLEDAFVKLTLDGEESS